MRVGLVLCFPVPLVVRVEPARTAETLRDMAPCANTEMTWKISRPLKTPFSTINTPSLHASR